MTKARTIFIPILSGFLLLAFPCKAQVVNCTDKYESALELYNFGMVDSALSTLKPCLENKQELKQLSKENSANIYRLAALSAIMMGNPDEADKYITGLLQYQPDYGEKFREDDLQEFRLILLDKSTHPSLMFGIRAGINTPFLELDKYYTDPEKNGASHELEPSMGFQIALSAEKAFTRSFSVEAGAGITGIQFDYKVGGSTYETYSYKQKISYLEFPVLARYYFAPNSSIKPYLQGGLIVKFSLFARERSEDYGNYWLTEDDNSGRILATFRTDMENIGLIAGGGVSYDLKHISIRADIRYAHHFNSSSRLAKFDDISGYEDIPASEEFGYTDDINLISINDLQISLGLVYYLKYKVF